MPDVVADPDKLRQYAKSLSAAAQQLEQVVRGLQRGLQATDWRDGERQRFEADLSQELKQVSRLAERLRGQHAPQLLKKAEALDRFRS